MMKKLRNEGNKRKELYGNSLKKGLERETEWERGKKKERRQPALRSLSLLFLFVPETGFEPARRFQRHHLKVVRLPISPPGQTEAISCKLIAIS